MRMLPEEASVWIDGQWTVARHAGVHLSDPGLQAGLGVFETLGVRGGRCLEPDEHLARLLAAAERFSVPLPSTDELRRVAEQVAGSVGRFGWLKIVATRGATCAVFGDALDPEEAGRPAAAILLEWRRSHRDPLAGYKTLNYAPFALGLEAARRRGADEAIWLNDRGHLAEGCASSLFVIHHQRIFTPSARDGILPGVTRAVALDAARRLGFIVHEGKVRLKRLEGAHEAFLTSSVLGVRPLVVFEGRPVGSGRPGPVTRAVAEEVRRIRAVEPLRAVSANRG